MLVSGLLESIPNQKELIHHFVVSHIVAATLKQESQQELTFVLPEHSVKRGCFEKFFGALDKNLEKFGIASYGITHTTLEEVIHFSVSVVCPLLCSPC